MNRNWRALALTLAAAVSVTGVGIAQGDLGSPDERVSAAQKKRKTLKRGPRGAKGPPGPMGPRGPAGAQGPLGAQGPPGESATKLFAVVRDDGTLEAGSGVVRVTNLGPGTYVVTFSRDVSRCAAVTAPGSLNGGQLNDRITSANRGRSFPAATAILVGTQRFASGTAGFVSENAEFNIAVFC